MVVVQILLILNLKVNFNLKGNYIIPNINVDESMVFDLTATKEDMKFQHLFKVEVINVNMVNSV